MRNLPRFLCLALLDQHLNSLRFVLQFHREVVVVAKVANRQFQRLLEYLPCLQQRVTLFTHKSCMFSGVAPSLCNLELTHSEVEVADQEYVQVLDEALVRQQYILCKLLSLLQESLLDLGECLPGC